MVRRFISVFIAALLASSAGLASELSPTEARWLKGLWPVIAYARASNLALDIVVQPQPTPDASPLALAFVDGRCKLVFSMRGNPQVQATLDRIEPDLLDATLELMAAHELGHCRRYLDGAWHDRPARFGANIPEALSPGMSAAYVDMKAARREEGYADLVGLAWTQRHHPKQYARLHAWLLAERSRDLIPGSHHDTLAWVSLARQGAALDHPSIFGRASAIWAAGLAAED